MHTFFLQVSHLFFFFPNRAGIDNYFKLVSGTIIICHLPAVFKDPSHQCSSTVQCFFPSLCSWTKSYAKFFEGRCRRAKKKKKSNSSTHCPDCVFSGGLSRTLLTFLNFKEMTGRKSTLHRAQDFKVTAASPLIIKPLPSIHFLSNFTVTKIAVSAVKEFRSFILFHYN